jgi:hypothetical protein
VGAGEFRAVGLGVVGTPQIADIVKQPGDDSDRGPRAPEARGFVLLPLVADQQPCKRQRDVERVLAIVIDGVDPVKALDLPRRTAARNA